MRAGLNKVPIGGAFVDTTCALGPTGEHGSCTQRYRACIYREHTHLGEDSVFPGLKSRAKHTLSTLRNQCL